MKARRDSGDALKRKFKCLSEPSTFAGIPAKARLQHKFFRKEHEIALEKMEMDEKERNRDDHETQQGLGWCLCKIEDFKGEHPGEEEVHHQQGKRVLQGSWTEQLSLNIQSLLHESTPTPRPINSFAIVFNPHHKKKEGRPPQATPKTFGLTRSVR